ncbi:shikimate kinase [Pinirhizobacter sp.]|jgi:shikimate kinase|uniref:shikimate kinase n=1 Tax=Pinirhizobacter sp. TaxID=2950432 RepID=UPI002F3F2A4C
MNPSSNLFVIGPTGAGKTSLGKRVAAYYDLPFVDLDQAIEAKTGVPVATIFEMEGEAGFRQRESACLDECSRQPGVVLATGGGAVIDPHNRQTLRERGFVIWLQVDVDQQLGRLEHDHNRPLLETEDRHGRLVAMASARAPFYGEIADLIVPPQGHGLAAAATATIELIDAHWRRPMRAS